MGAIIDAPTLLHNFRVRHMALKYLSRRIMSNQSFPKLIVGEE
jgi:hypothetical protein